MAYRLISKDVKAAMVESYLAGATLKEAAGASGCDTRTCQTALRQAGLRARSISEVTRKYRVNEKFFDEITDEQRAYWLGFWIADGGITIGYKDIPSLCVLNLARRDVMHLHKWKAACESDHPVTFSMGERHGKPYEIASVRIGSRYMAQSLGQYGVVLRKSTVAQLPEITPALNRHMFRGLVDGDGSVFYARKPKAWYISLTGTLNVVTGFRDFLVSRGIETNARPLFNRGVWDFRVGGNRIAREIGALLWDGATVYLDRKYEKYVELMKTSDGPV